MLAMLMLCLSVGFVTLTDEAFNKVTFGMQTVSIHYVQNIVCQKIV